MDVFPDLCYTFPERRVRKVRHVTYILQHAGLPLLNTLDQERVPLHVYFVLGQCRLVRVYDAEDSCSLFCFVLFHR